MSARRPRLELLEAAELDGLVGEACRVLETVGILVENQDARDLLDAAGAPAHDDRHRIPERVVREAVASAPRRFVVYDRDGAPALDMGGDAVHFDPGSAAIHILDPKTQRRRDATSRDAAALARLVDGLQHYAAQSTAVSPADVPREMADRWRLYVALMSCRKPVVTGTFRKDGFAPMRDMLAAVRGSQAELAERPLAIFDCCPSPPLKWSDLTCQALIDCAKARVPATLISMPLAGATSPVTLREAVVQHTAESLSGVVIHQLAAAGAPITWGGAPSAFDMRQGTTPMGAVETMMIDVGAAQVGRHLGFPTHGYLALSDAKVPDYQAGLETGIGAVVGALAGINLISGPGILDYILTQSLEKLLLDHEACGLALRLLRGIEHHEGDSVSLIAELVKAGSFLAHAHTRKHWRQELSLPGPLVDRATYGDWEKAGALWAHERAASEVEKRGREARVPALPESTAGALTAIMQTEAARFGLSTLPPLR